MVLVMNNGKIEPRRVEVGLRTLDLWEIKSGIAEGDDVLVIRSEKGSSSNALTGRMRRMGSIPGLSR